MKPARLILGLMVSLVFLSIFGYAVYCNGREAFLSEQTRHLVTKRLIEKWDLICKDKVFEPFDRLDTNGTCGIRISKLPEYGDQPIIIRNPCFDAEVDLTKCEQMIKIERVSY